MEQTEEDDQRCGNTCTPQQSFALLQIHTGCGFAGKQLFHLAFQYLGQ